MDGLMTMLTVLLTAFLAYQFGKWQDKNKTLTDLKINLASEFMHLGYDGLTHLQRFSDVAEASRYAKDIIKKSEVIGIFFEDHIYKKTVSFKSMYMLLLQLRSKGDRSDHDQEIDEMLGILSDLRIDFKKMYTSGDFGSTLTQISQRKWLRR